MEAMTAKFWWTHKKEGKGIHWKSWSKLGAAKGRGAWGFETLTVSIEPFLPSKGGGFYRNPPL